MTRRREDEKLMRWMNVRHPFSRLLSAWRNKFAISFFKHKRYMSQYGQKIKEFTTKKDYLHADYTVPFRKDEQDHRNIKQIRTFLCIVWSYL